MEDNGLSDIINEKTVICFYTVFHILMQPNSTLENSVVDFHLSWYQPNVQKTLHLHEKLFTGKTISTALT